MPPPQEWVSKMPPPQAPYPITGIVYEPNGTAASGAVVVVENTQTGDRLDTTTNSSGEYSIDASDFDEGYTTGDKLFFQAYQASPLRMVWERNVAIDTAVGYTEQDLTLLPAPTGDSLGTKNLSDLEVQVFHPPAEAKKVILVDGDGKIYSDSNPVPFERPNIKDSRMSEAFAGSAGTGSDGDSDRVYTLSTSEAVDIVEVFKDGTLLTETSDYTKDDSAKTVTLLGATFDSQTITIFYNV